MMGLPPYLHTAKGSPYYLPAGCKQTVGAAARQNGLASLNQILSVLKTNMVM